MDELSGLSNQAWLRSRPAACSFWAFLFVLTPPAPRRRTRHLWRTGFRSRADHFLPKAFEEAALEPL